MKRALIFFAALSLSASAPAQDAETDALLDSLVREYNLSHDATQHLELLKKISLEHYNPDSTLKYSFLLLEESQKRHDLENECNAYRYIAWSHYNKLDYIAASEYAYKAIEVAKAIGDMELEAMSYTALADATSALQDDVHADEYYHEALKRYRALGYSSHITSALRNMGHCAVDAHMWDQAHEYFAEAMQLDSANEDLGAYGFDIYYLGYLDQEKATSMGDNRASERDSLLTSARNFSHKAYNLIVESKEYDYLAFVCRQIAENYLGLIEHNCKVDQQTTLDSVKWWLDESSHILDISGNFADRVDISLSYASYLTLANRLDEAADSIANLRNFLMSSIEHRFFYEDYYKVLRQLHIKKGDYKAALIAADSAYYWKDKSNSLDFAVKASHNAAMAKFHEREAAYESERAMRGYAITALVAFLALIVVVLILVARNNIRRKRDNARLDQQNAMLSQQEEELRVQNEALAERNDIISNAHREMTDSLNYARLIQQATMPSDADVKAIFPNCMILFRPLNIVSGDFYWAGQVEHIQMIAVADCTGHGVPGAVMSMLGLSLLNAVKGHVLENGVVSAARVLDKMRAALKVALHQRANDPDSNHDGLDIALVAFDTKTNTLHFAGAFRPLIVCRKGEVIEFKGDRMPIGIHVFENDHFSNHEFQLISDDMIYLFSDGIVDQFGIAPSGESRKFTQKRLRELLARLSSLSPEVQKREIAKTIDTWRAKGNADFEQPQTDDTLIVGFRV